MRGVKNEVPALWQTNPNLYYKQYREKNRARLKQKDCSIESRYKFTRWTAKNKKKEFSLSFEQYKPLIEAGCYYCGDSILNACGCGLDRLNTKLGYLHGNVVGCCWRYNTVKGCWLTPEETKFLMAKLKEFRNGK